jgi:hypothetical protein
MKKNEYKAILKTMAISIAALRQSLKLTEKMLKQAGEAYRAEKAKVATLTDQLTAANAVIASYNELKAALVEVEPEPQYLQISDSLKLEIGKKYHFPNWQKNDWFMPAYVKNSYVWGTTNVSDAVIFIPYSRAHMLSEFTEPQP